MSHTAVVIVIKWKHRSVFWSYLPLIFLHFVRHVNNAAAFSISPLLDSPLTVFDKRWGSIYIYILCFAYRCSPVSQLPPSLAYCAQSVSSSALKDRASDGQPRRGHWTCFGVRFVWDKKGGRGPHEPSACGKYGRSAVSRQGGHLDQHRPKKIARRQRGPSKDDTVTGKKNSLVVARWVSWGWGGSLKLT
jgi:hypothetical protein